MGEKERNIYSINILFRLDGKNSISLSLAESRFSHQAPTCKQLLSRLRILLVFYVPAALNASTKRIISSSFGVGP